VAPKQQAPPFVARLAKKPLSEKGSFGIMRVASQKEFGRSSKPGAKNPREFPKKALK
jgi:hypothetical protein